ncbi:hypothetical protein L228DRAFT_271165 [Xylona heveae TC161]|uniref:SH3 domain-containing protein n=1 Tax=Xylona heveae (strain CBS 132557 / TC161) TaxID=1328760 RepID=A0A164ZPP8_XYLHT|nr:hypothetical protein L228DRAFT_271165 [Xylona heveae TC161]KZF19349.1 hypothetical protein L228DRAFT_271165 [Xylona heveae TC161]
MHQARGTSDANKHTRHSSPPRTRSTASKRSRSSRSLIKSALLFSLVASATPTANAAAQCVSLSGSQICPAFNVSSISTDSSLVAQFPFLAFVSDTGSFDQQLKQYITTNYAQQKYQQLLGCSTVDLKNTSMLYARYTASTLCNAIIQNSKTPCSLSDSDSRPLCADTCAQFAMSEQEIISSPATCGTPGSNANDQIRADFTNCALPANSLSGQCITGVQNENDDCGYSTNLNGLCSYCAASSPNATDSCCANSNVSHRCSNVHLPSTTSMPPLFGTTTTTATVQPTNASSSASAAAAGKHSKSGLSGGQIAGIVIGSVLGAALLLGLLIFCCMWRRKRGSEQSNVFNQPSTARRPTEAMAYNPVPSETPNDFPQGFEPLPGARVARMSALEAPSTDSPQRQRPSIRGEFSNSERHYQERSSSDYYGDSPGSIGVPRGPIPAGKRNGSLSSGSFLGRGEEVTSPESNSNGQYSSPEGVASAQSEQLSSFKDYYSQDEIHTNDKVAVLWAYSPRAPDEFELERGDMLKIVGIWDDGWATGVRLSERAEEWDASRKILRDSGVSNVTGQVESSPAAGSEIRAFPLVCVCLPEHWKKTLEADISTDTGSSGGPLPILGQGHV